MNHILKIQLHLWLSNKWKQKGGPTARPVNWYLLPHTASFSNNSLKSINFSLSGERRFHFSSDSSGLYFCGWRPNRPRCVTSLEHPHPCIGLAGLQQKVSYCCRCLLSSRFAVPPLHLKYFNFFNTVHLKKSISKVPKEKKKCCQLSLHPVLIVVLFLSHSDLTLGEQLLSAFQSSSLKSALNQLPNKI